MNPVVSCMDMELLTYFLSITDMVYKWLSPTVVVVYPTDAPIALWQKFNEVFCYVPWQGV